MGLPRVQGLTPSIYAMTNGDLSGRGYQSPSSSYMGSPRNTKSWKSSHSGEQPSPLNSNMVANGVGQLSNLGAGYPTINPWRARVTTCRIGSLIFKGFGWSNYWVKIVVLLVDKQWALMTRHTVSHSHDWVCTSGTFLKIGVANQWLCNRTKICFGSKYSNHSSYDWCICQ